MEIKVLKNVLIKNTAVGNDNRKLFNSKGILAVNIVSSPGAGKTTLLESLIGKINIKYKIAVIEGDLYTSRDALRLEKFNIPIAQINTEGGCHLDARMVNGALKEIDINGVDVLFIENVGNLVCPSSFDLGEHTRVLVYSVTEGADKPQKYATMFKTADVVLINKMDLAEICKIDVGSVEKEIKELNPKVKTFKVSATDASTLNEWLQWLEGKIEQAKKSKD